ncbi:MAG TPA: hypothetical protein VF796_04215 [Humisphaera sp.]
MSQQVEEGTVEVEPSDAVAAAAFAVALRHGAIARDAVVEWADALIAERTRPQAYLIDLSLSQHLHVVDLEFALGWIGCGADPLAVCSFLLGMLPDVSSYNFEDALRAIHRIFRMVREIIGYNDRSDLIRELYSIGSTIRWI